jgi:signal transduction histidine kinase/ActR/RegA family two-component response regulator
MLYVPAAGTAMFQGLVNLFVPASARLEAAALRRARRFVAFALAMMVWVPVYVAVYLALRAPASASIVGAAGVALTGILLTFRRTNAAWGCGHCVCGLAWWTYTALALATGGHYAPSTLWYATVPVLAVTLLGTRAGIGWSLASAATIGALYAAAVAGLALPSELAPDAMQFLQFNGLVGMLLCVLALTVLLSHVERGAQQAIAAALDEVQAADRAKSEFLANMSHELRTPMTAILGYADLLADRSRRGLDVQVAVETIQRNGQHLLTLVNDILDLSKIEAGRLVCERLPCSPRQLVADVVELLRVRAAEKGLELSFALVGQVPAAVTTDPTRLRQILINLVGNAIKFTEHGQVRVEVHWQCDASPAPALRFEVHDTGVGITEGQLAQLFQPFRQGDGSTSRRFGGTGLGLAISRRLAELLGGTIEVSSRAGEGTTFRVTVAAPELAPSKRAAERSADRAVPAEPGAAPLAGLHVLLAEDSLDNQRLIVHMLRRAGADVETADDGRAALDGVLAARDRGRPFDVVLMDMQMPVLDGYQATQRLREAGYAGAIVALTAHSLETDRQKCLAAGCDDYASKPIPRAQLVALVQRHAATAVAAP